jgi:hypothetical protein
MAVSPYRPDDRRTLIERMVDCREKALRKEPCPEQQRKDPPSPT